MLVIAAGMLCLNFSPVALARTRDKLDGDWEINVTPDQGATRAVKDVIHFKQAAVSSDYFVKLGLPPAMYETVEPKFGPVKFSATAKSDSGAKIDWQGTILANSVEGTVKIVDKNGTEQTYSFSGTRKE